MRIRRRSQSMSRSRGLRHLLEAERGQRRRAVLTARQAVRDDQRARRGLVADVAERSDVDIREDVDLAVYAIRHEMLEDARRALGLLDRGRYGRCTDCGGQIAPDRLDAQPSSTRCLSCEDAREMVGGDTSAMRTRALARELASLRRGARRRLLRR